jgi:nucleotide-binding universal stress UspA family protein
MKTTSILVPTDFTEASDQALRYAELMAHDTAGELRLLHLVPDARREPWAADAVGFDYDGLTCEWVRQAEISLKRLASELPRTVRVRTDVRLGRPPEPILAHAAEHHADLIVLAAHAAGGNGPWLRSGTAERVARRASCPVLVVPARQRATAARTAGPIEPSSEPHTLPTIGTILVPIDFATHADEALACSLRLAGMWGAAVHVLHVNDPPWARNLAYVPPPRDLTEDFRRCAERKLASDVRQHQGEGLNVRTVVLVGDPFDEIMKYSAAIQPDLIVMGTHGREFLGRLLLGSVTEKVLRQAPCPVLTLHAESRASAFVAPAQAGAARV